MGFQAAPDVTGDLDWSTRPGATLRMTTRNVRTAARTQIRHHTLPLARTRATPPQDNLLHGRAKHDTRAERSLGAGVLTSSRPVWHAR